MTLHLMRLRITMHQDRLSDAAMRTTINLSEATHQRLLSHARDTGKTLSETVDQLLRRAMYLDAPDTVAAIGIDPATLLPIIPFGRSLTVEDVRSLEDDA